MKSKLFHPERQKSLIDIFYKTQTYACLYKASGIENTPQFSGIYYLSEKDPSPLRSSSPESGKQKSIRKLLINILLT